MFDLVRVMNSAIDARELTSGDAATIQQAFDHFDRVLGVLSLRRAEENSRQSPSRRSSSRSRRAMLRGGGAISLRRIGFARISRRAASCSKTARRAHAGRESEISRRARLLSAG